MKSLYRAALGALLGGLIGFFAITPAFAGDHHDARVRKAAAAATSTPTAKTTASPTYTATPVAPVIGSTTTTHNHQGGGPIGHDCKVTADRGAGISFIVHNSCLDQQTVIVSVQKQPGPWYEGICKQTGQCELLNRHPEDVLPGDHTISAGSSACFYQVDLKWRGTLIKSNHFTNECSTPSSSTSTSTTSTTTSSTSTPPTKHNKVCDSDGKTQTTEDDCLAFTGATPLTRILMILGPAIIIGGAMMRFAPWSRAGKH